jgi:hypothetical protein
MAEANGMKTNHVAGIPLRGVVKRVMGIRMMGHTEKSKDEPYDLEREREHCRTPTLTLEAPR